MSSRRVFRFLFPAVVLLACAASGVHAETRIATIETGDAAADRDLPFPLSDADVDRYTRILDVQEDGDWKAADTLIAQLEDSVLMGYVQFQRYMHPTKYRSRYKELRAWLEKYGNHPEAERIYELAKRRQPKNALNLKRPTQAYLSGSGYVVAETKSPRLPHRKLSKSDALAARKLARRIRFALRQGATLTAKKLVQTKDFNRLLSNTEQDELTTRLAAGYLVDGETEWSLDWSERAANRSGKSLPLASWTAGLAAWRLGQPKRAARHFETVANHRYVSSWMASAGAFWAARARLANHEPAEHNRWLGQAAEHPRTFYGILARHILGMPMAFRWELPPIGKADVARIRSHDGLRRALALIQLGDLDSAEHELRVAAANADRPILRSVLAISARAEMPALATRVDGVLASSGIGFDGASFPAPSWNPEGGYTVDRALVFALIRQESGFNPDAKSSAGARGLMQLMPGTASYVAGNRHYRRSKRSELHDLDLNLRLGQKYIDMLLDNDPVNGDLFLFAAAWNGGPGNLRKWVRRFKDAEDPLLFIETIPLSETRIFVERVLANLWAYRDRFGQASPSLDAVAAGGWPTYMPLDPESTMVARNVEN